MKRVLLCLLSAIMLFSCATIAIQAETASDITPYWSNGTECTLSFVITQTGEAEAYVSFTGIPDVTTEIRSEIYIQKKFLGIFWKKVDIGVDGNIWVDSTTEYMDYFTHTIQLEDTGTYRAVFELTFSGTGGADDVVSDKIEKTYG